MRINPINTQTCLGKHYRAVIQGNYCTMIGKIASHNPLPDDARRIQDKKDNAIKLGKRLDVLT